MTRLTRRARRIPDRLVHDDVLALGLRSGARVGMILTLERPHGARVEKYTPGDRSRGSSTAWPRIWTAIS
jgi:hypothetical protein